MVHCAKQNNDKSCHQKKNDQKKRVNCSGHSSQHFSFLVNHQPVVIKNFSFFWSKLLISISLKMVHCGKQNNEKSCHRKKNDPKKRVNCSGHSSQQLSFFGESSTCCD